MRSASPCEPILFSEELGAVLQVRHYDTDTVLAVLREAGLSHCSHVIGCLNESDRLTFTLARKAVLDEARVDLQRAWAETSFRMQALRDNPDCARAGIRRAAGCRRSGHAPAVDLRSR